VGQVPIGPDAEVFIIAEVGNAHDGSLNFAHAFIDAIAPTGAHAIKFQTHIAAAESTPAEPFRVKFSYADDTRYDYWRRLEFTPSQWAGLKRHAEEAGLIFLSSPFSPAAVELLTNLGVAAWKVPSGETNNAPLLEMMLATGKPLLISTGMSSLTEVDRVVGLCQQRRAEHLIFHCTSSYPCPPEMVGLNIITEFLASYDCPIGLSDHSGDIFAGLAAVTLGVQALEVHVTLSRDAFGPDVPASLTPLELGRLVAGAGSIRAMLAQPRSKDDLAAQLEPMRRLFSKSLVYGADLPAGTVLGPGHLLGKKPGTGLPVAEMPQFYGLRLRNLVKKDQQVSPADFFDREKDKV
jgi:N-acetylneuraminate synthase